MSEEENKTGFAEPQAILIPKSEKSIASRKPFGELPERVKHAHREQPHYLGHRERLRQRFKKAGSEAFSDYEILELLLFRSITRADTKERSKALLKRFGSLAEVLGAPYPLLQEIEGIGKATALDIKIIASAAQRMAKGQITKREVLSSWEKILEYCRIAMAFEEKEQFRILFLDKKNGLIADEVQQKGTVDHTSVYPREIVKRALELSSSAIILAHNHPSGDPYPSTADIAMTHTIIATAKPFSIAIHDHIIIAKNGFISMREAGLLDTFLPPRPGNKKR